MNFGQNVKKLRQNSETSNVGTKWTPEEESKLLEETENKTPLEHIAKNHKRTIGGIESHLCLMAYDFVKNGDLTLEEASDMVNIDKVSLKRSFIKMDSVKAARSQQKIPKVITTTQNQVTCSDKYIEILVEIRDLLKILTNKLLICTWFFYFYLSKKRW